jgi:ribonucrease Y
MNLLSILGILVLGGISFAIMRFMPAPNRHVFTNRNDEKDMQKAREEAELIRKEAEENVKEMKHRSKEEEESILESIKRLEELMGKKESLMTKREQRNQDFKKTMDLISKEVETTNAKTKEAKLNAINELSAVAKLSEEKALANAKEQLEEIILEGKEKRIVAELEELEEDIMKHATAVLQVAIQRLGVQSSVDKNSTTIKVKDDKFKGMLVGRDGENIIYLESLLPISVIFNHGDPKNIHIGGVNLFRRNIAKRAITKLETEAKKKKAITHKMIDEAVEAAEKQIMKQCDEKGRWALKKMGIDPKSVDPELKNYVGRLYFRTSYGQNIIHHSLEMAYSARLMAELIGADVETAMLGTFYHDIGKAIDHDIGGSHDDISKELLEKYGFDEKIVQTAYCHHDKVPCIKPADFLCKAADAISGGRPGARMESVTNYFERMKELEKCATHFKGVRKVLTMSAGREVRVLVDHGNIKDADMDGLADNIAEKISEEVSFPGIIKVNLVRLTKASDYAREKQRR